MDLISRTRLLQHIDECIAEGDAQTPITNAVLLAIKCAVEQMPRIEAVPVWNTDYLEEVSCHECKRETEWERKRCIGHPSCSCCDYDYKDRDDIPCSICKHNGGTVDFWQHKNPFGIAGVTHVNETRQSIEEDEEG